MNGFTMSRKIRNSITESGIWHKSPATFKTPEDTTSQTAKSLHDVELDSNANIMKDIHICFHYEKDRKVHDPLAEATMKNLGDYYCLHCELCFYSYSTVLEFSEGIENTISQGKKYMLFIQLGNQIDIGWPLIHALGNQMKEDDYKFIGHVLDYKNGGSFFIHPQMFLIDAVWAKNNNIDSIQSSEQEKIWTGYKVERSDENFHDDYTPLWVKGTNEVKEYKGRGLGWSIIEKLCETGSKFAPFDRAVRKEKSFIYPHVNPDTSLIHRANIINCASDGKVYLGNTENIRHDIIADYQNVKNLMLPASGSSTFLYPYLLKNVKFVTVYDNNPLALYIFEKMWYEWDGVNYQKYLENLYDIYDGTLFAASNLLPQDTKNIFSFATSKDGNEELWSDWWQNRSNIRIRFVTMDFFDHNTWYDAVPREELVQRHPSAMTLINISNILHFRSSSAWYSAEEKLKIFNRFNQYAQSKLGKGQVHFFGLDPVKYFNHRKNFVKHEHPRVFDESGNELNIDLDKHRGSRLKGEVKMFTDEDFKHIRNFAWR